MPQVGLASPLGQGEAMNGTPTAPGPPAACVSGETSLLGCTSCPHGTRTVGGAV